MNRSPTTCAPTVGGIPVKIERNVVLRFAVAHAVYCVIAEGVLAVAAGRQRRLRPSVTGLNSCLSNRALTTGHARKRVAAGDAELGLR